MDSRLFRLAAKHYPERPVAGAVFGRHERAGAKLIFLVAVFPPVVAEILGWPLWLGASLGAGLSAAMYSLRCDNFVFVLVAPRIRVHRPGRIWWFRVPLGTFDREIDIQDVQANRGGVFNDTWLVDGLKVAIRRHQSEHFAEFLRQQSTTPPPPKISTTYRLD